MKDNDRKLLNAIAGAVIGEDVALAYRPPMPNEIEWKMPEIIYPAVIIEPSGQEKRRERRKQERKNKKR